MTFAVKIDDWEDLPPAISRLQRSGASHRAVLLQALYRGLCAHIEIQRNTPARLVKTFISTVKRPALVLIGDDDDLPTGPGGWHQAARLSKWANWVIIHAAVGRVDEYHEAVTVTLLLGRVLLIESTSANARAWQEIAMAYGVEDRIHIILPARGVHPVPIPREKMQ